MLNKLILIVVLFSYISLHSDEYVTEEKLEPGGFGLFINKDDGLEEFQHLETELYGLKVSPDGSYIAFITRNNFYIYNLQTDDYDTIGHVGYDFSWSPDSRYLVFVLYENGKGLLNIYNVNSHEYKLYLDGKGIGNALDIDSRGRIYYQNNEYDKKDSSLYYYDFLKSLKNNSHVTEKINLKIEDFKKYSLPYTVFGNEKYFVCLKNPNYIYTNECKVGLGSRDLDYCSFYKMDTNFNVFSESKIKFDNPDHYNVRINEPSYSRTLGNKIRITKNNEIFIYLNVRHIKEIENPNFNFTSWDSTSIEARNKSGYYRMDTNCGNMKQLVRMWANVGGITATGDGEIIYYGYMKPNRNCVIMKMNKFGKKKVVVIDLENLEGKSSVEDNQTTINNISYYPNPSKDILNIKLIGEPLANEEIEVFDLMGQNLLTQKIYNIQTSINIQKLNTGIYYCKLKHNGTVFKFEVVK
ncbi:MAG: T9SS type A sorting domain-containing protein [Candidatus Kapabacteria bacterium]|nr:T9SS type A sorting domain-containing protein [Candidatus Kapabacteria bacterium]